MKPPSRDSAPAWQRQALRRNRTAASATADPVAAELGAAQPIAAEPAAGEAQSSPPRRSRSHPEKPKDPARRDAAAKPRATATNGRSGNGRRRRFSLPPLDDDHDKVNRSIESFLSGGETASDPDAATDREPGQPPTTVALVAVIGTGHDSAGDGSGESVRGEAAGTAVKRALRAAARGTDRVESLADSRFRVVLAATGELAARAYLRRVRTTVEPVLETLDPPRSLAVATATMLGEPIDRVNEVAERRLLAAIEATQGVQAAQADETRAAGD